MWIGNTAELLRCIDNTLKQYNVVSMVFNTANLEWSRKDGCDTYGGFGDELKSAPRQAMDVFMSYDFEEDGDSITFQPIEGHMVSIPVKDINGFSFERCRNKNRREVVSQHISFELEDINVEIYNAYLSRRVLTYSPREMLNMRGSK